MGTISYPSFASLLVTPMANGKEFASATGFVVVHDSKPYLISNWHVLSGREPDSENPSGGSAFVPTSIRIWHNTAKVDGRPHELVPTDEPLCDSDGAALWLEHPEFGSNVDAAALPLGLVQPPVDLQPFVLSDEPSMDLSPGDQLSIVGFPYGRTVDGRYAIWIRGSLATDHCLDYENTKSFLVDARTRKGQSGSPVIQFVPSGSTARLKGQPITVSGDHHALLGVYAGRLNRKDTGGDSSDLGRVWKSSVIREILVGAKRAPFLHE
ncbi:MAG: trypsin-like peptidase domain-containing protein [Myxococcaceae bacterium]